MILHRVVGRVLHRILLIEIPWFSIWYSRNALESNTPNAKLHAAIPNNEEKYIFRLPTNLIIPVNVIVINREATANITYKIKADIITKLS